ncbi:MAG: hypothetical protein M1820_002036 [Bogoriella megaspora]|nr:MAG: hypothetical protein M1820_002036 [Bogoriella megaspora]
MPAEPLIDESVDVVEEGKQTHHACDKLHSEGTNDASEKGNVVSDEVANDGFSPGDPANPKNWSKSRKWSILILLSLMGTMMTLATLICAPAIPQILQEFGSQDAEYSVIIVSVWEIGELVGLLLFAPASEVFGRLPVWHTASILFVVLSIGLALSSSLQMITAFRFINGMAYPIVLNAAIAGDMFDVTERGKAMSVMSLPPLIGPVFGPTLGGLIAEHGGWRWTFWFITILSGTVELLLLLFLRETYPPKIFSKKAKKMESSSGDQFSGSKTSTKTPTKALLLRAIVRPLKFLLLSPISTILSLYLAIVYGYLYLVLTTLTEVLQSTHHFSETGTGLAFIGLGLGLACGALICRFTLDRFVRRRIQENIFKPEDRLLLMVVGSIAMPVGLFVYGWTLRSGVHWILPIIGTTFIGLGLLMTQIPAQTYLVDAFSLHAASATAALFILRTSSGTALPLAGPPLYSSLGLGWGNSLLGFIALIFIPLPLLLYRFGELLRCKLPVNS